jgi:hypothetical protein
VRRGVLRRGRRADNDDPLSIESMFECAYLRFNLTIQRFKNKIPKLLPNVIGGHPCLREHEEIFPAGRDFSADFI